MVIFNPLHAKPFPVKRSKVIAAQPALRWTVMQRGYWVHGVDSFADYIRALAGFTLSNVVQNITCPTLVTQSEGDPIAAFATRLHNELRCPKRLVTFTAAEGAGGHCETLARSLYHQRVYDWLDEVL